MSIKDKLVQAGIESSNLDEIVHEAASRLATSANNDGMSSQIEFLSATCCWSDRDIEIALEQEGIL